MKDTSILDCLVQLVLGYLAPYSSTPNSLSINFIQTIQKEIWGVLRFHIVC